MTEADVRAFFDDLVEGRWDVVFEFPGRRFGGRFEGKRRALVLRPHEDGTRLREPRRDRLHDPRRPDREDRRLPRYGDA